MKIAICGSMSFAKEMYELERQLECKGHKIVLPRNAELYANGLLTPETRKESTRNKIEHDLINAYFGIIERSDAILIVNLERDNIPNYIGGNGLIEMAFAYILGKKIFLLNPVPQISYSDEIEAMRPVVLNGNLSLVK